MRQNSIPWKTKDELNTPYTIIGDWNANNYGIASENIYILFKNAPPRFIRFLISRWFGITFFRINHIFEIRWENK